MNQVLLAVGLAGGALGILFLASIFRRWPGVVFALAGLQVVLLAFYPDSFTVVTVEGLNVTFADVFSAGLVAAWLIDFARSPRLRGNGLLFLFCALLLISIGRGIAEFDVGTAVNEGRGFVWIIACVLWSSGLDWSNERLRSGLIAGLVVLGWVLVVFALARATIYGVGAYGEGFLDEQGNAVDGRVLTTGQALVLLIAMVATIWRTRVVGHPILHLISALAFAGVLLLSQQRTVWVITLAVFVVSFFLERRLRHMYVFIGLIAVWAVLVGITSGLADGAVRTLTEAFESTATIESRSASWITLLEQAWAKGPATVLFGDPFGSGYARIELGRLITYQPHNWYVNLILRVGVVGLVAYLALIARVIVGLIRAQRSDLLLWIVTFIGYGWTYNLTWFVALLLGTGIGIARAGKPALHHLGEGTPIRAVTQPGSNL